MVYKRLLQTRQTAIIRTLQNFNSLRKLICIKSFTMNYLEHLKTSVVCKFLLASPLINTVLEEAKAL